MTSFPAHINDDGKIQSVREHCLETASFAAERLEPAGLSNTAYLAGLLHDMGKCKKDYRVYIENAAAGKKVQRGSVNHTFAGVIFAIERWHTHTDNKIAVLTAEIIAYAVGAHHGEFDIVDFDSESGFEYRLDKDRKEICYEESLKNYLRECAEEQELDRRFSLACAEIEKISLKSKEYGFATRRRYYFICGLIARMVLSAVIEGDRRSTAEFMDGSKAGYIEADKELWKKRLENVETKISCFDNSTPINKARRYFSDKAAAFTDMSSGIFRLTLPTGSGKTLTSLRLALANAAKFTKKRIIFVIPLLSVLEQNRNVIRENLGDDSIITEHHSNVIRTFETPEELDRYELLTETWESPVIITTLVQLLDTLFKNQTTAIRRTGALADSIIVIDEVQSLPKKTISMFNMAMNFLAYFCDTTVVLSSATQPEFGNTDIPLKYSEPIDIIPYEAERFDVFKRTEVVDKTSKYGMDFDELADFAGSILKEASSLLIICNTKNSSEKIYESMKHIADSCEAFHLSAAMCMKNREDVLKEVKKRLEDQSPKRRPVICVSTQIVEAGVDISFECVIRIEAGIDNIAQAAGRCNRSNDFGRICKVYIVNLKSGCEKLKMLREIETSQRKTQELLGMYGENPLKYKNDILSSESISCYYRSLFDDSETKLAFDYPHIFAGGIRDDLYNLLAENCEFKKRLKTRQSYLLNQAFLTAGSAFEVFDENTYDVIVPYKKEGESLIADLNSGKAEFSSAYIRECIERAKPYTIRIFEYQRRKLIDNGMLCVLYDGHFMTLNGFCYSDETGLKPDDMIF